MGPLERIGTWLQPIARGAGLIQKGEQVIEPVSQTVESSDDLYALIYGTGLFSDVHPILAYRLFLKSDVLGGVVHRIAREVAGLTLGLTTDGQDFEQEAPVLEFLRMPTEGYSKRRLFYELVTSYLLTNEAWLIIRGRVEGEPVGRTWVYPFDVTEQFSSGDGLPTSFRTNCKRDSRTYRRKTIRGRIRWISDDNLNELIPILGAEAVDRPYRGQSQLAHLYYAVTQGVEGKRHNTAMLKNGLRLTGALQPAQDVGRFGSKAVEDLRAAIQALRGSGTAGGTLIFPERVDTVDMALTNQEMDYINMLHESADVVYNYYGIPLPLMSNEASTFNNFSTAQTALFDGAIFPVFDELSDALRAGLIQRFPELEEREITYNENTIRALKGRNLERMEAARKTQAITTNEVRDMGGYPEVDGGDSVLIAASMIPLGDTGMSFPTGATEPVDQEVPAGADTVQDTALNGAQIQALVDILLQVSDGLLSLESARAAIAAAFPDIDQALVDQMLDNLEIKEPSSEPDNLPDNPADNLPDNPLDTEEPIEDDGTGTETED